jgi:hypothetical protein
VGMLDHRLHNLLKKGHILDQEDFHAAKDTKGVFAVHVKDYIIYS